jgi:hypothetical protein
LRLSVHFVWFCHRAAAKTSLRPTTKGTPVQNLVQIEDIREMRRLQGIEDVELEQQIRDLHVGDFVRLTLLKGALMEPTGETVEVRITSIKGAIFTGKLRAKPTSHCLAQLAAGAGLRFTAAHIHSCCAVR